MEKTVSNTYCKVFDSLNEIDPERIEREGRE